MDYDPSPQVPFYSGVVASQGISWMDSLGHFELATGQAGVGHRYYCTTELTISKLNSIYGTYFGIN